MSETQPIDGTAAAAYERHLVPGALSQYVTAGGVLAYPARTHIVMARVDAAHGGTS